MGRGTGLKFKRIGPTEVRHFRLRRDLIEFLADLAAREGRTQAGQLEFMIEREKKRYG